MKPYEHYTCQNCTASIPHEDYTSCKIFKNKTLHFDTKACDSFNPRIHLKDRYMIYVLIERVDELERIINKLYPGGAEHE